MAIDTLFFLRTGSETGPYVLVGLRSGTDEPQATATLENVATSEAENGLALEGGLTTVLRDANEYALLNGYDLRIDLAGQPWPDRLGIIGNSAEAK